MLISLFLVYLMAETLMASGLHKHSRVSEKFIVKGRLKRDSGSVATCPLITGQGSDLALLGIVMLSVSTFILVFLGLSGDSTLYDVVPLISGKAGFIVYGLVVISYALAVVATFFIVVVGSRVKKVVGLFCSGLCTYIAFRTPSLGWILHIHAPSTLIFAIIYFSILMSLLMSYYVWWVVKPERVVRLSVASSGISYALLAALSIYRFI